MPLLKNPNLVFMHRKQIFPFSTSSLVDPSKGKLSSSAFVRTVLIWMTSSNVRSKVWSAVAQCSCKQTKNRYLEIGKWVQSCQKYVRIPLPPLIHWNLTPKRFNQKKNHQTSIIFYDGSTSLYMRNTMNAFGDSFKLIAIVCWKHFLNWVIQFS